MTGVYGSPNEFYFGATGGGVWKSTDSGENWKCVSDGFFKYGSVGAIEVSRSNPKTVVVGMGETEVRGNISSGDGVYRSDDGGETWRHLGLASTQTIARVRIHPKNPNIIWVAALGHIYGAHSDRGIYKSTDGGTSWRKVLFVDDRSGAADISVDQANPNNLYATTWTAWRTPYSLNSGGPGSKIWKSTDGGETWSDISTNIGLPSGVLGKMGIAVSEANPLRVYAMIEAKEGGLYRSEDAGTTWKLINGNPDLRQRPWYYTRVYADPKNADAVWVLNVGLHRSSNGGQSFTQTNARHSDNHDFWIDPSDTTHLICGNDGGANASVDNGRNWSAQDTPTAQFYHVSTDNSLPYRILGAQQDNSTVRILSRTFGAGIGSTDWTSTAGGESGYVSAKPNDPEIVFGGSYGGDLSMMDHRNSQNRAINPWPDNPMGAGTDSTKHRFQWTYPIVFSPHDPDTLYTCSQHVMRSKDGGGSWQVISPDLTSNDKSKQGTSGGPITQDNTSVEYYCTVFTVAESPKRKGTIWAGSDDGLVHVTSNSGGRWRNVTPANMPKNGLCSMVDPSPHDASTAFLAVDNHENDDHAPYVFITRDGGSTWSNSVSGLPNNAFVRVVREDLRVKNLLYCGTEIGVFFSPNGGERWYPFQMNLPIVPIHDIALKNRDLIVATHGRSFWILDDLTPVQEWAANGFNSISEPTLFPPAPGFSWGGGGFGGGGGRRAPGTPVEPMGTNPMQGLIVNYYLPVDAKEVKLEMMDVAGTVVATGTDGGKSGFNRTSLAPRYPSYRSFPGLRHWDGGPGSIKAPPGAYRVKVTVDGKVLEADAIWGKDPRSKSSDKDLIAQFEFSQRIAIKTSEANDAIVKIRSIRGKVEEAIKGDSGLISASEPLLANLLRVEEALYQTKARSGQDFLNYPIRLNNKLGSLLGVVQSGNYKPTKQSYEVFAILAKQTDDQLKALAETLKNDLGKLNEALKAAGKPEIEG